MNMKKLIPMTITNTMMRIIWKPKVCKHYLFGKTIMFLIKTLSYVCLFEMSQEIILYYWFLEKITDLIRVYNEFPCKKFLLSSSGLIQSITPNKIGVYTLAANLLVSDRLVYVRETRTERFALISPRNPNDGEYQYWMVRYGWNFSVVLAVRSVYA